MLVAGYCLLQWMQHIRRALLTCTRSSIMHVCTVHTCSLLGWPTHLPPHNHSFIPQWRWMWNVPLCHGAVGCAGRRPGSGQQLAEVVIGELISPDTCNAAQHKQVEYLSAFKLIYNFMHMQRVACILGDITFKFITYTVHRHKLQRHITAHVSGAMGLEYASSTAEK